MLVLDHGFAVPLHASDPRRHHLAGVKLDQHGGVRLQLFHRNGESEVVEHEELQLQVVQLGQRESTNLFQTSVHGCHKSQKGDHSTFA